MKFTVSASSHGLIDASKNVTLLTREWRRQRRESREWFYQGRNLKQLRNKVNKANVDRSGAKKKESWNSS